MGLIGDSKGAYLTVSNELKESGFETNNNPDFSKLRYGSAQYFELFEKALKRYKQDLVAAGLFEKTWAVVVPFATRINPGEYVPLKTRGMIFLASLRKNWTVKKIRRIISRYGFNVMPIPNRLIRYSPSNKWTLASYHYGPDYYR